MGKGEQMNPRYTDSPQLISLDLLAKMDKEAPGTYLFQTKYDGARRQIWEDNGGWHYRAKNNSDAMPIDPELKAAFESIDWPKGVGFDCELMGSRDKGGVPRLYIFDVFMIRGEWIGHIPFKSRSNWVELDTQFHPIQFVVPRPNPGMVDAFAHQMTIEGSEGLVIRRADSTMIGNRECSVENPHWFKVKFQRIKSK